jgi:hypothetical protein
MSRIMNSFKQFSGQHPFLFGIVITLLVFVCYVIAGFLAEILGRNNVDRNLIEASGRLSGSVFFLLIIRQFRWAVPSGIARWSSISAWLLALTICGYEVITHVLPLTGGFQYWNINPIETISVSLNALTTGPLEENPFRGLILYAFIRLWADSEKGIMKSVLLSAILFGASHLIHILIGRPIAQAKLIALNAALAGVYYAAIVIRWNTVWPGAAIHGLLNVVASIVAYNTPGFEEPVLGLTIAVLFQVPLVGFAIYLIRRDKPHTIISYTA